MNPKMDQTAVNSLEAVGPDPAARLGITRSVAVTALALGPVCLVLVAFALLPGTSLALRLVTPLLVLVPAVAGWLIVRNQPRNVVGWFLLAHGALLSVSFMPDIFLESAKSTGSMDDRGVALAAYLADSLWTCWFAGMAAIAFVFPDGRLPSAKWRKWAWVGVVSFVGFTVLQPFTTTELSNPDYAGLENPLPQLPAVFGWLALPLFAGVLVTLINAVRAVRSRLKLAEGDERLQLLWFAWAALTIPGALILCITEAALNGGEIGVITLVGVVTMVSVIPFAIAVGMLRYKLFDIELVLNRTLVYGALTILLAAVYAGIVAGVGALIGSTTGAGLIGAGIVAAIVQPVHARIQRRVDRWVFGDRTDPYAALQRLDARLRETQTPSEAVHAVVETVAGALRLPYAAVEFDRSGESMTIAVFGARGRGSLVSRELWHRGENVGSLVVEVPPGRPLAASDERLLDQLASHVGAAVQSVRLTVELQQSRKDLVTTREEERRRLRRDLHDGVGPSLAAMSLQLDVLKDNVSEDDLAVVDQLSSQVHDAITDIRRLVYELRPPALDQYGLVSALTEHAARLSNGPTRFAVVSEESIPPLPAAVEVAVYRIALEGMTNAARHSGSTACDVRLTVADGLSVTVEDDGVGIDKSATQGVGLSSMRERVAELGGEFAIAERAGGGTRLLAVLPLEAT